MSEEDRLIRERLTALRSAPVPPPPSILPGPLRRKDPHRGRIAAAAAMLVALPLVLYLIPPRSVDESPALSGRIAAVEARLALVRDDGLRELLRREIELLRRELQVTEGRR